MTILFSACEKIKPSTRNRRFGAGLLAYVPTTRIDHTADDELAYAQILADQEQADRKFNQHIEERYARSMADDVVSSGRPWL